MRMTIEEAKEVFLNRGYISVNGGTIYDSEKWRESVNVISKWLEQEPVLDKIRAEIEEQVLESLSDGGDDWFAAEKVNECLDIIDKYQIESEGIGNADNN